MTEADEDIERSYRELTGIRLSLAGRREACHWLSMKSYSQVIQLLLMLGLLSGWAAAQEPLDTAGIYPFKVTVGGQEAKMQKKGDLFAVIAKPVKTDALLKIEKQSDLLIVNAFRREGDGTVANGTTPAAMFAQKADQVKLNATLDKKVLKPGRYLMNVVAHSKTSRVVVTVDDPEAEAKLPSLTQITEALREGK